MENLVFLLSYSPCPLFSSLLWLYFGFLIGISCLHCIGTMKESCVLSFRAWVSGGTQSVSQSVSHQKSVIANKVYGQLSNVIPLGKKKEKQNISILTIRKTSLTMDLFMRLNLPRVSYRLVEERPKYKLEGRRFESY